MPVNVGIIGVGNIASMLIQSIEYYRKSNEYTGVMHTVIDRMRIDDINVVYAIDISENKVGKPLNQAIYEYPNVVQKLVNPDELRCKNVIVRMGKILDGVAPHMVNVFKPSSQPEPTADEIVKELEENNVDVLVNLLPVGSSEATRFYAKAAAKAGVSFINCIPEFIASDKKYVSIFKDNKTLVLGDDIKGQLGATILHRAIASLLSMRGCKLVKSYQLNVGGNTDFLNMLDPSRLTSKKISKTMAVASTQPDPDAIKKYIYAGPSGYVEFLGNTKIAYMYLEAISYGGARLTIDVKLVVDDKSMAAAVLADVIRIAKALKERGIHGSPYWASAPFFKHPPKQLRSDWEALSMLYTKLEELGINISPKYVFY